MKNVTLEYRQISDLVAVALIVDDEGVKLWRYRNGGELDVMTPTLDIDFEISAFKSIDEMFDLFSKAKR